MELRPEATDFTLSCNAAWPSCTKRKSLWIRTSAGVDELGLADLAAGCGANVGVPLASPGELSKELSVTCSCSNEPRAVALASTASLACSSASISSKEG